MHKLTLICFIIILFLLFSLFFYCLLAVILTASAARSRLQYVKRKTVRHDMMLRSRLLRHMRDLLLALESSFSLTSFMYLSLLAGLSGTLIGSLLLASIKGALMMGSMGMLLPYLLLRMRLLNKQMRIRLDFLPAVELFYQYYMLDPGQNIRRVLQQAVEEKRMREPIRSVFEQLQRNLAAGREVDEALSIFNTALGHRWSQFFSHIFHMGYTEGVDVSSNLKDLIVDMRKAILANQQERNRLLEIRIANFTPVLFLLLFMFVNYKLNPAQTVEYYFVNPEGKSMLLDAVFLIFLSFLMGVYLSMKRI